MTAPDFTSVIAEVQRHPVSDMAILIGDENGTRLAFEKNNLSVNDPLKIASASKLLTGLAIWSEIENGTLSEDMKPSDFISSWPKERRSEEVSLGQLLSFTSGFNQTPAERTCAGRVSISLEDCVFEIAEGGPDTVPGESFAYGPEHMQIAALLTKTVTGQEVSELLRSNVLDPINASFETGFLGGENTRYSGNAVATTADYAKILQGLLSGVLISDQEQFLVDRTDGVSITYRPLGDENAQYDWHYGAGFWIECDVVPFHQSCAKTPTISSAGARGFVPWIDFEAGYWAIIAMEESGEAARSIELQQTIQPMIIAALNP